MPQGVYTWSKTAAANSNADSSINWAEGMAPSAVNDSARAVLARIAEWRDDNSGSITTTGTATAYIAASNQAFASLVLMDKRAIVIVPHVTSGASPTLNVDGLGAKPLRAATGVALAAGAFVLGTPYRVTYFNTAGEWLCDGAALADSDVQTANLADLSVTTPKLADAAVTTAKIAPGSINAAVIAPSFMPFSTTMINGTLFVQLLGGGAMLVAVKTLAGIDPTVTDPTTFLFRDQNAGTGNYDVRTVTAPLSLTIPVTQTLGFINSAPGRFWILAIDNAGTVELAVFNAVGLLAGTPIGVSNIFPLHAFGIISTQPIASILGAGIAYSQTARTSRPFVPIGYVMYDSGVLPTAGQWTAGPSRFQIFQPGSSPLPGSIIQSAFFATGTFASGSVAIPVDNTVPQITEGVQYMAASIAPSASANVLMIEAAANCGTQVASLFMTMALFQDANVNALATTFTQAPAVSAIERMSLDYQMQAGTAASTTFRIRAGADGTGSAFLFNGVAAPGLFGGTLLSSIRVTEIMG